jgi:hypothetical protein
MAPHATSAKPFAMAIGDYWDIDLKHRNNVYYGLSQVTGYLPAPTPECPLTLAKAASHRTGEYLSTILENMKRRYGAKGNK